MSTPEARGGAPFLPTVPPTRLARVYGPPSTKAYIPFLQRRIRWFGKYAAWTPALGIAGLWFIYPALSDNFLATVVPGYAERHGIKLETEESVDSKKDEKPKKH